MNKVFTAFVCALLVACSSRESAQFAPPRFVSAESEKTGRNAVTLHCTLSDNRVETCGFLYGSDGVLDRRLECELSGLSFEASVSGISDGVDYSWCAFATAGGLEIRSDVGTFRSSGTDPVPIEDPAFLSYLLSDWDYDSDGVFSYSDADHVKFIRISSTNDINLQSLKGLEYMPNLEEIDCPGEWCTADRSTPPPFEHYYSGPYKFDFWGPVGTLKYVDVTHNPKLKRLNLGNNSALGIELGTIDLSNNTELRELWIGMTWMEYPDISNNVALVDVGMSHLRGALPSLSALSSVRGLFIEFPQDKSAERVALDVSNMPDLEVLYVHNRIGSISELSANRKLKELYIGWNGLESLDVSFNRSLEVLVCENNKLESIDVSGLTKLRLLDCSPMDDAAGNNMLQTVYVSHGQTIPGVTEDRSSDFIPSGTMLKEKLLYPPDDELWYTTFTEDTILVSGDFCPGLILLSNTYENGLGVMRFDFPVSTFAEWALYYNEKVESLVVPSSVKATSYSCFRENMRLRRVVFAPGLIVLGDSSLHHNEGLQEVILPDTVKSIEKDALSHCYSLVSLELPSNLEYLGQSAFLYCTALRGIVLPASLKSIGIFAFEHDKELESITCLAPTPPSGGTNMFHDTGECPIYVPAASVEAYRSAPYWSDYAHRIRAIEE